MAFSDEPNNSDLALCHISEINPKKGKGFIQNDLQLFAVKSRNNITLYLNRCPHVGLPLNWVPDDFLDADAELIQCKSHGALFRLEDGHCVAGPCVGQSLQKVENYIDANDFICVKTETLQTLKTKY